MVDGDSPVEAYSHWLRQQHRYADNTRLAIDRDLAALGRLLPGAAVAGSGAASSRGTHIGVSSLTAEAIRTALSRARSQGASAATVARMASSWRGFFRFLMEQGLLQTDPLEGVRAPKKPRRLPKALSPDEALQLLQPGLRPSDSVADDDPDPHRLMQTLALAELLYGSGLRIAEAIGLDRTEACWRQRVRAQVAIGGWIDWDAGELQVVGKGSKPRVVPLTSHARAALGKLLTQAVDWADGFAERPLFVSARGLRLSVRSAQRDLAWLAQQAGLARHVHPHMLRHSFASHVLQSSGDLRAVQELMGHASIASTQVYTALDFQHLSAAYDQAHPRARKRVETGE